MITEPGFSCTLEKKKTGSTMKYGLSLPLIRPPLYLDHFIWEQLIVLIQDSAVANEGIGNICSKDYPEI